MTLREYAAAEVRAHLARQRMSARALALAVGEAHTWATRRVSGAVPMTTDDVERIANALGMSWHELLGGGGPTSLPPRGAPAQDGDVRTTTRRKSDGSRRLVVVRPLDGAEVPSHSVPAASVTASIAA